MPPLHIQSINVKLNNTPSSPGSSDAGFRAQPSWQTGSGITFSAEAPVLAPVPVGGANTPEGF
jgi:hypothetical protein